MSDEITAKTDNEQNRIIDLLSSANVPEETAEALRPIIENLAWMKSKLDDARETIKNSQVAIPYDNGGGQRGIRENPLFKGYEALWKSYLAGMEKILAVLPAAVTEEIVRAPEPDAPKNVLELIMARHTS